MPEENKLPAPDRSGPLSGEPGEKTTEKMLVATLNGYMQEADQTRKTGENPRDQKWSENLNLYWGRFDFSKKAAWQAKEVLPEVPSFVDRFAAALKEALVASPTGFYTVVDPGDTEKDLAAAIKRMSDVWLTRVGRNQNGTPLEFPTVFEEQVKLGALMAMSSTVLWKRDVPGGRVAIETVDPRFVWLDHTYRNLYRIRRIHLDRHQLFDMAKAKDGNGNSLFNLTEVERLVSYVEQDDLRRIQELTGQGAEVMIPRVPIVLDEYLCTVLRNNGKVLYERALCVVANKQFLVRGPEPNPFWHGKDWVTFVPLVTTPLSVYGRSYMEDFGSVAKTFNELTNLILDAVHTSSMNAFAVAPDALINPEQLAEGISPNKMFLVEGADPKQFAVALELGKLPAEAVNVWTALKNELREAAGINEIGLGQFAPKGRTSATEVMETQQSSSALVRSVAQTIETRWLDPTLDLVWQTGLQHVRADDLAMANAAGPEMFAALMAQKRELVKRPISFQARGISTLIQKSKMLRNLIQVLQVIGSNELLLKEFLMVADMKRLVALIFDLSDIDMTKLQVSERERLMRQVAAPLEQAMGNAAAVPGRAAAPGQAEARDVAGALGVAKGG